MNTRCNNIIFYFFVMVLIGCTSSEDKVKRYVQSGYQFLEQESYIKAGLQFRNALQIDDSVVEAWYGLSLAEEKQGKLDKVFSLLSKVIELNPDHLQANIKLGKIYLAGKAIDKALEKSERAASISPENADVRALRGAVLLHLSDREGAIREAKAALAIEPNNIDALIVMATERLSVGNTKSAIDYLNKGIAVNEKNLTLQIIKIKALDKANDHAGVAAVFNRLIELYPEDKNFRIALAKFYKSKNKTDLAENEYRKAISFRPTDVDAKLDLVKYLLEVKGQDAAIEQLQLFADQNKQQQELKFALAELYILSKEYNEAEKVYFDILEANPDSPVELTAKNKLAALKLQNSDLQEATKIANEVLAEDASNTNALILKATIALKEGFPDKAIVELRTVLKNEPDSIKAHLLLSRSHLVNGSVGLAKNNYRRALQINPGDQKVVLEYAALLVRNKELNSAEDILQVYIDRGKNLERALQAMAQLKLKKGQWEEAYELVQHLKQLGSDSLVTEQLLGLVYKGRQKHEQSIEAFKRAHQASPSSVQPIVALVRGYVRAGKHQEAVAFLLSVLDVHPTNLSALVLLAQRYELDKKYHDAEILLKRSIKSHPDSALGFLELSRLYSNQGKYSEAMDVLTDGLTNSPKNISLKLAKARVFEKIESYDLAIKQYEKILNANPSIELAANNLASLIADHKTGKKNLERALELSHGFKNSVNPYFRDTLGWVYYKLGVYNKATPLLMSAVESVPSMPVFRYHLAQNYLAQGDKEKAKQELKKAISLSDEKLTGMSDAKIIFDSL